MRFVLRVGASLLLVAVVARGQKAPLLPEKDVTALANELSGETAKRNLEGIARFHRQRGSRGFHEAVELVAERLRAYGLSDVAILQFPADGATMYGTQRSRPAWDGEFAELREMQTEIFTCDEVSGKSKQQIEKEEKERASRHEGVACDTFGASERLIESYEAEPIVLAEDSESADVTADLVNVGEGNKESDYGGKDVKGKIVLVSAQPGAVQDLAVGKLGAVGIVSYAQNQKTAWSGENLDAIRWGHLETFSENKTFGFMMSLKMANAMKERLAKGEKIRLHAVVKAGRHPGNYEVVTATIPGADAKFKDQEIAFSCHLDHQRPGANDNASGCATILEVARALQKLISQQEKASAEPPPHLLVNQGRLLRPARTIRFIFPPEIEGTMALLNAKPEFAKRIKAVVHMDMVGGGPETKAVFHVTRGPMSLPSFVHDVALAFAEFVNEESYKFAATGEAKYPMVAPEGGKEPLRAEYSAYTMGSDHDVYQDSSFGIPAIYLNDWPDRYIHTNFDTAANIDPTKLKRAAFIGAASAYFLANISMKDFPEVMDAILVGDSIRETGWRARSKQISKDEVCNLYGEHAMYDLAARYSYRRLSDMPIVDFLARQIGYCPPERKKDVPTIPVFRRAAESKGPLAVFGYNYFEAEWAKLANVKKPQLLEYQGLWGGGEEYAYEVLNFADGKRNDKEIRDAVSAEYGPVPLEMVEEYLRALEKIGVVEQVK
jgi:aminopeptidase YwaD